MANPVIVADVENRWHSLAPADQNLAQSLLTDAWEIMLARVPSLQARLDDLTLSVGLVVATECAMVLRVMKNPDGKRQESIDDYAWVRDNAVSAGLLYLSVDELALLSPVGASTSAFTIRPYGEPGYSTYSDLDYFGVNL